MWISNYIHSLQGRIQDLKLGVAQMDWKIWKPGVGVGVVYFIYFLLNIFILYRVDHSVTLFCHGALSQSKMHRYKEHIYTHS